MSQKAARCKRARPRGGGTLQHLFFACPFAIRCWQTIGIQWQYGTPFFQMLEIAKHNFNGTFFMEIFTIAAWQIWKQRNGLIFENCSVSFGRWKSNFVDECRNQAHRMKVSLKNPFLTCLNTTVQNPCTQGLSTPFLSFCFTAQLSSVSIFL